MLRVKIYCAGNGDAFLLSAAGSNVLVDGGYAQTFDEHILPDLLEVARRGERLDLVIASHIDADHIAGLIRFLTVNESSAVSKIVPIDGIWHNSLRSLTSMNDADIHSADRQILDAIHRRGHPAPAVNVPNEPKEISARQGSSLASLIHSGGYRWNVHDGTTSIALERTPVFQLAEGNIHVIGPAQKRIDELLKWWKGRLRQMGYNGPTGAGDVIDDAFELMCEYEGESAASRPVPVSARGRKNLEDIYEPDISITNGSSIATIVELGGVRILMLADAWAEDVVQALRVLQSNGDSMFFDAIKISHHGSLRNTSPDLLQLIDAPRYIVSSNGNAHDHPDVEVLVAIVDRPASFSRTLYFNYPTPASALLRNHASRSGTSFTVHDNATEWIEIEGQTDD
jgi:Metallo-beta-lactamase superfamily